MDIVDKIEIVKAIIEANTSYSGSTSRLEQVNPNKESNDFIIKEKFDFFSNNLQQHRRYYVLMKAASQTLLETMIAAMLALTSGNPSGYEWDTATYPYYISIKEIPFPTEWKYKPTSFRTAMELEARWEL